MKERMSVTVDPETLKRVEKIMKTGRYRNVSHLVEDAIKLLGEVKNEKNKR
jgi:Arc/MetJ-type ribon-helix-helix transcriptional regulator